MIAYLAEQIGVPAAALAGYDWVGRSGRRHRQTILDFLAVVPFDEASAAAFRHWLAAEALPHEPNPAALEEEIGAWFAHGRRAARRLSP